MWVYLLVKQAVNVLNFTIDAAVLLVGSQITYILPFFLSRNIHIACDRAWDQMVASRGKGPDFWQPYVEEWKNPPFLDSNSKSFRGWFGILVLKTSTFSDLEDDGIDMSFDENSSSVFSTSIPFCYIRRLCLVWSSGYRADYPSGREYLLYEIDLPSLTILCHLYIILKQRR